MRTAGLYYDPSVHDWGSKVVQGGLAGLAAASGVQKYEAEKMKLDEAKKMQAVKDEIRKAHEEYMKEVKPAAEVVSGAEAGFEPTQAGAALAAEQGVAAEGQGLAGMLAQQQAAKAMEEQKAKPLIAKAQFMTKAKEIFEKHGMVDQAMALGNNYMKHVKEIGDVLGPKAALKELKTGMLKDQFEGVTENDISNKNGTWKVEAIGPNKDGIVTMSPDGKLEIVREPTPKEDKDMGGVTGLRHFKEDTKSGTFDVTEEYDKTTKTWKEKSRSRIKDTTATGSQKDEKWTAGKVRQEYNNLNSWLKESENDILKQVEESGQTAENMAPEYKVRLEKIRNIRQNIMKYRSDDEWNVTESKEAGKYPRNLKLITDYLSGFGPGEKPQEKDITKMTPTPKGSTSGEVKKTRKSLDEIF